VKEWSSSNWSQQLECASRFGTRERIKAIALLDAFVTHWPERSSVLQRELLERLLPHILQVEPDRFYKQRRLALAKLSSVASSP
jgi:hypothetical protein